MSAFLQAILKYDPDQPRAPAGTSEGGQWVRAGGALEGYSKQASLREDGVIVTSNVDDAVRALSEDRHVELTQVREVATLLDKLAALAHAAEELGEKAPVYDLCKVTIKGTNLFCADAFDLTREQMPQFIGYPEPGSPSDALPRRPSGKVDVAPEFLNYLKEHDYTVTESLESASYLRASQRQLNGAKVGQMMEWLRSSSGPYEASPPLVVSEDNYIIDGHHRWAALVGLDAEDGSLGDLKLPVQRVNIKVVSLLMTAKQFTKHMGVRSESVHTKMRKSWLTVAKEAVWNEALHPRHPAGADASRGGEFARQDELFSVNVIDTEYRTGKPSRRKVDVMHRPTYAGLKRFGSRELRWIKVPSNNSYFVWDSYEVIHEKMLNALVRDRRIGIDDESELRSNLYGYAGTDSLDEFTKRAYLSKSWLQIIKDAVPKVITESLAKFDESQVHRAKTTPESNSGSFAPHPGQGDMFPATKEDFEAEVARGQAILDADRARAAAEAPPPSEMVALYHGTADDVLPMILKEGLRPGSETGVRRWSEDVYYTDPARKGSVFVVDDVTKAIKWAKEAARKAADADWEDLNPYGDVELVILKVELPRAVYAQMKDDTMLFDGHLMHQGAINPEWIRGYVKGGANDDHIDLLSRASLDIELMPKVFVRRDDALAALEKSDTVTVYVPLVFFSPKLKKSWLAKLLKWNDEDHPRGETVEGTNKGSFRPRNMGFVSPNVDENVDFQEAASRVQSHRTKLLLEADEAISEYFGTQTHESVGVGAWADGAEQSIIVDGPGDFEAFKAHMAMSGLLAEQKAIIAFTNDAKGPDSVYRLSVGNRPLKEVHSALLEAGVQFHTLRKTDHNVDVFVFAPGTEQETQNAIAKAAEHFGVDEVDFVKGYGEFLGSWDSREEGRAAYEAVLDAYESKVPGRDGGWKEFRDRWWDRFQAVRKSAESWLEKVIKYSPDQPRGKTTPESNEGSFAPRQWAAHHESIHAPLRDAMGLTAEDVKSGKYPLLRYKPKIAGTDYIVGQYDPTPEGPLPGVVTLSDLYFKRHEDPVLDEIGRRMLLLHEVGHSLPTAMSRLRGDRGWDEWHEVLAPFKTGGSGAQTTWSWPASASPRSEEILADVYADLMYSKAQPWEDEAGKYAPVYKYVLAMAVDAGLPLPAWHLRKSWLQIVKDWDESKHPRGKTSPESTPGSFAPAATQIPDDIAQVLRGWTQNDQQWEWSNMQHAAQYALSGKPPKDYLLYDYRGDDQTLLATAKRTIAYLNEAPSPGRPLYRGLHGNFLPGHRKGAPAYLDEPVRQFKVGDEFSESLTSWTGKKELAKEFADDAYSDKEFRSPRKGTVLVLDPEGARAAPVSQLADARRKILREADEWMASGRYRVTEITKGRDGTQFVHVRRVGAASHENIAKDAAGWDESKHPRGKTTPESNSGSFSHVDGGVKDIDLSDPKPAKEFYVWRVGNPDDGLVGRNAGTLAGVLEYLDQADEELVGTAPTAVKFKVTLNTDMAWGGYENRSGDFESLSEKAARKRGIVMSPRIGRNNRGWLSFPRTGFIATPVEVVSTQDLHRQMRKSWLEKVHATAVNRPDR